MNIGDILSRAWKIVWKHKILWLFGILASCGQASGSSNGGSSGGGSGGSSQAIHLPPAWLADLGNLEWVWIMLLIAAGVVFVIFMIFVLMSLNTVGRVGVVRGALQAEEGKEKLSFGELLSGVKPFFWRVLGLNLLIGISVFALVILGMIALAFITIITFGVGLLLILPLLLLFVPLMWMVVVLQEQANVAMIVEDIQILEALKRSWQVVVSKPANYLVMGLILILGVGLLGILVIGLPMLLVFIPMIIGLIAGEQAAINTGLIFSGVCFVAYMPFLLAVVGIMRSYIISSWTLSYLEWRGTAMDKPVSAPPKEPVAVPPEAPAAEPASPPTAEPDPEPIPDPLTGS